MSGLIGGCVRDRGAISVAQFKLHLRQRPAERVGDDAGNRLSGR